MRSEIMCSGLPNWPNAHRVPRDRPGLRVAGACAKHSNRSRSLPETIGRTEFTLPLPMNEALEARILNSQPQQLGVREKGGGPPTLISMAYLA